MTPRGSSRTIVTGVLLMALCCALLLRVAISVCHSYHLVNRGIETPTPLPSAAREFGWGVNVSLEQYDEAGMRNALTTIRETGISWVRQTFPWDSIQPSPSSYDWKRWDRIVDAVGEHGLHLTAVLNRSPSWARAQRDRDNPYAPPADTQDYVDFSSALAARYAGRIAAYQIWDQPNIAPSWGAVDVSPAGYVDMLRGAFGAIKAAAPAVLVVSAGLAPNTESLGRNLSDVAYLSAMYDAGAGQFMDVVGAKAYGFWSGPDDRRADPIVLNYSRVILLREVMVRHGDAEKAIWAVEMGWNSLPSGWRGQPSPWGTDDAGKQAERTLGALTRAREEWPWLGLAVLQHYQPDVPVDDPLWGFALVDVNNQPRPLLERLGVFLASPESDPPPTIPPIHRLRGALAAIGVGLLIVLWRAGRYLSLLPLAAWWRSGKQAFLRLVPAHQAAIIGGAIVALVISPWDALALLALWAVLVLALFRLEYVLLFATFAIPFTPFHRTFWGKSFSYIEILTLTCLSAWALQAVSRSRLNRPAEWLRPRTALLRRVASALPGIRVGWRGLDGAWLMLLGISILSLATSRHLGVSMRELRTVVVGPALFFLLMTRYPLFGAQRSDRKRLLLHLTDALVLAGVILAVHGLTQRFGGGDVIVTEGVRRIRGIYASPNNLSLVLGRILPIALAFSAWGTTRWRRLAYGVGAAPMLLCLFLTFSRGAWLLGIPASLLTLGLMRGRRAALIAAAAVVLGIALLFPVAGTDRIASLLDGSAGTTLFRLSLWRSTIAMIRDHPVTGVGLDTFLYYYPEYIREQAAAEPNLSHPHNIVLDFWSRLGLGGLVALLWFAGALFRRGRQLLSGLPIGDERAMTLGYLASLVNMTAHGLVDNSYFVVELAFILALTTGWLKRLAAQEEDG